MKNPSRPLLALYERCLVGSLVACEVNIRELDALSADDFSDVRSRRLFVLLAEIVEEAPLEYPASLDVVTAAVESLPEHGAKLASFLFDAVVDYVSRDTALAYAKIITKHGGERRRRSAVAARIARAA